MLSGTDSTTLKATSPAVEQAAAILQSSEDFKVLRKIKPVQSFHPHHADMRSRVGVAVDVETTGLNSDTDKIIELAVQRFLFDDLGRITKVGQPRVWREDPGVELDPQITQLTGLTDAVLKDQVIDDVMAADILNSADLIIAHNATFDRPFVDKRLPAIAGKPWACSMREIDWLNLGFDGRALAHLVAQCGWFYEGHRAENDILALIYLLAHDLPDGRTLMAELVDTSERDTFFVNAVGAPFDTKDLLKARGYRWNATMRFWSKEITEAERESEAAWLNSDVYFGYGEPSFISVSACERYTASS